MLWLVSIGGNQCRTDSLIIQAASYEAAWKKAESLLGGTGYSVIAVTPI